MRGAAMLLAAALLAGCAGPRPAAPSDAAVAVPPAWRGGQGGEQAIAPDWWRGFGDPALDALVARAVAGNVDLLAADTRIAEARAQFRLAASRSLPSVAIDGNAGRSRALNPLGMGIDQTHATGELTIAYEADLFGRLASATDASRKTLAATGFARDTLRIALVATIVSGYATLRGLDAQRAIVAATVEARAGELAVIRRRYRSGYGSLLELRQAETAYESAARLVPVTELAITRQENGLSLLAGDAPGPIARGKDVGALVPGSIPQALPADLLRQRPDIAEAEARLGAADRSLDAARAAFMPSVQLSASGGAVASTLLSDPVSLFSLGGSILAPLFRGGALRAEADAAAARRDAAAYAYRKTVLTAFGEVEDAMAAVQRLGEEAAVLDRQVEANRASLTLAQRRYRAGYASYLDQLDAERSLLDIELQRTALQAERLAAIVALYRSLGGGWGRA
ncbi:NodT family efflux transporter outer membrane factor (OMF) lipoprotein [Sphingomonas zeicaulis]|uniref:efflux transporter outer membrane subunit n=1 Tax=Sphingomonas zeicaulis TaxID=1632740 RepID=UPI003D20917F